jgi:predicted amidohydrolase YtcJ
MNRRHIIAELAAAAATGLEPFSARAQIMEKSAELILVNAKVTTLDRSNPQAQAVAMRDGLFLKVGTTREVMVLADSNTKIIDVKGRRVVPGLIDSHMHIIRGGLNYNMELRWDGVRSLSDALAMLRRQDENTPPPQWVRVVGGFSEHQFSEKRFHFTSL